MRSGSPNSNTTQKARGARVKTARPKQANSISSKAAILVAAEKLFASEGFRDTTLQDIAKASGVNSALVAYYYGSKNGLLRAVIDNKLQEVGELLNAAVPEAAQASPDGLRATIRTILEKIQADETFHRIGSRVLVEDEEMRDVLIQDLWQRVLDFIAGIIRKIHGDKLPIEEVEVRALTVCGLMHHYANLKNFTLSAYKLSQPREITLENFASYFSGEIVDTICSASSWASGRRSARK